MNFDVDYPLGDFDLVMPSDDGLSPYVGKIDREFTEKGEGCSVRLTMWHVGGWPEGGSAVFIEEAEPTLTLFMKWDGCGHYDFGPGSGGYLHLCGGHSLKLFTEMLHWLWGEMPRLIPSWDAEVAS